MIFLQWPEIYKEINYKIVFYCDLFEIQCSGKRKDKYVFLKHNTSEEK